jgi:hypothetical protein
MEIRTRRDPGGGTYSLTPPLALEAKYLGFRV